MASKTAASAKPHGNNGWGGVVKPGERKPHLVIEPRNDWADRCDVCSVFLWDTEWPHLAHLETNMHKSRLIQRVQEPPQPVRGEHKVVDGAVKFVPHAGADEPEIVVFDGQTDTHGYQWCNICVDNVRMLLPPGLVHCNSSEHQIRLLGYMKKLKHEPSGEYRVVTGNSSVYFVPRKKTLYGTPCTPAATIDDLPAEAGPEKIPRGQMRLAVTAIGGENCKPCEKRWEARVADSEHFEGEEHITTLAKKYGVGPKLDTGIYKTEEDVIFYYPYPDASDKAALGGSEELEADLVASSGLPSPSNPAHSSDTIHLNTLKRRSSHEEPVSKRQRVDDVKLTTANNQPTSDSSNSNNTMPSAAPPRNANGLGSDPLLASIDLSDPETLAHMSAVARGTAAAKDLAVFCNAKRIEYTVHYEFQPIGTVRCTPALDGVRMIAGPWDTDVVVAPLRAARILVDFLKRHGAWHNVPTSRVVRHTLWADMLLNDEFLD